MGSGSGLCSVLRGKRVESDVGAKAILNKKHAPHRERDGGGALLASPTPGPPRRPPRFPSQTAAWGYCRPGSHRGRSPRIGPPRLTGGGDLGPALASSGTGGRPVSSKGYGADEMR